MSERGFRLGTWQVFAAICVLAVAAIAVLVCTAPPPAAGPVQRRPGEPRNAADSTAYMDSLVDAAERNILSERMSLAEAASRVDIPVDSLVAELRLPATASLTEPLRALAVQYHFTLKDVSDARKRVERRLGRPRP